MQWFKRGVPDHPWAQNIGRRRKRVERVKGRGRSDRWEIKGSKGQGNSDTLAVLRNDRAKYPNHRVNSTVIMKSKLLWG